MLLDRGQAALLQVHLLVQERSLSAMIGNKRLLFANNCCAT